MADAAAAPCQPKIAFGSNRTGNNEIFLMGADGGQPVNLTNSASDDRYPVWSPDGKWIAFNSTRAGTSQIYVMPPDGQSPVLVSSCSTGSSTNPVWRFDSNYIVYQCRVSGAEDDLLTVPRTGGTSVNLTSTVAGHSQIGSLSPDGNSIAFSSDRTGNYEVFKMGFDGSSVVQLTSSPELDFGARWSPSGAGLLFVSNRGGATTADTKVYKMQADGSGEILFRDVISGGALWSPNGAQILSFQTFGGVGGFVVVNNDATGAITISPSGVDNENGSWAPDGSRVAFDSGTFGSTHIVVSNVDGTGFADLTPNAEGSNPAWQPACQ